MWLVWKKRLPKSRVWAIGWTIKMSDYQDWVLPYLYDWDLTEIAMDNPVNWECPETEYPPLLGCWLD
jgi:hypothetical protein